MELKNKVPSSVEEFKDFFELLSGQINSGLDKFEKEVSINDDNSTKKDFLYKLAMAVRFLSDISGEFTMFDLYQEGNVSIKGLVSNVSYIGFASKTGSRFLDIVEKYMGNDETFVNQIKGILQA